MGKITKSAFAILGIVVALAGLSIKYKNLETTTVGILLLFAGLILLLQVAWRKINDGKFNEADLLNIFALVLGIVAIVGGLAVITGVTLWLWLQTMITFVAIIAGIFIVLFGLIGKD